MAKKTKKQGPTKEEIAAHDLDPDAWPKFEELIRNAGKKPKLSRGELDKKQRG